MKDLPRLTFVAKHLGENDFLVVSFSEFLGPLLIQEGDKDITESEAIQVYLALKANRTVSL